MNNKEKKSLKERIFNDTFKWYDLAIITVIIFLILEILCAIAAGFVDLGLVRIIDLFKAGESYTQFIVMYLDFITFWIVFLILFAVIPIFRPMLKPLSLKCSGNTLKTFIIGLGIGFGLNMICAVIAMINKDIAIYYNSFYFFKVLALFVAVFIQSSAEELLCRVFLYQRLRKAYRNPLVAILGNSLIFAALHLGNPGMSLIPFINIIACGILFSVMIYYFDSFLMASAAHCAWNFTQNIILGLPNSGIVTEFSIFSLDASKSSLIYDASFGIEGGLACTFMYIISIVLIIAYAKKHNLKEKNFIWN